MTSEFNTKNILSSTQRVKKYIMTACILKILFVRFMCYAKISDQMLVDCKISSADAKLQPLQFRMDLNHVRTKNSQPEGKRST